MTRIRRRRPWMVLALGLCTFATGLPLGGLAAAQPRRTVDGESPTALRLAGSALGAALELEVLDLPRSAGEKALHAAWDAVVGAERELAALGPAASGGKVRLSPDLGALIARANSFCFWSDGASGPAGGAVYRLWAESARSGALPSAMRLEEAAAAAKCARVVFRDETRELELAPGTELDLRGFSLGWAVDLAARTLLASGAVNFKVTLGPVIRAAGVGPGGTGWTVFLPTLSASGDPQSRILLQDQAIAVAEPASGIFAVGGEQILPAYDLRSGRPATGVSSVAAVTTLAADAEPLAMAMSVLGANGGQIRLGSLRPKPSVLWLLGSGETAVVSSSNWSAVRKP